MHRPRYYRNPAMYNSGAEFHPRFPLNNTRNTYRTTSTTPFSPSQMKEKKTQSFSGSRFVDRSKYVWTANKQPSQSTQPAAKQPSQSTQPAAKQPSQSTQPAALAPVPAKPSQPVPVTQPKKNPNSRELNVLTVTALDSPVAVAKDIALNLREKKVYLLRKVVDVVGVKKAIKLYYDTKNIENNGGILVQNGKRRRTPGGVFLSLLRESKYITPVEAETVFNEIKKYELQTAHYYPKYW